MTTRRLLVALALVALAPLAARADTPDSISYQGVLTLSGVVVDDGLYAMRFRIYDNPTSGSPLYTSASTQVQVTDGLYNVILTGIDGTTALEGVNRYMQVTIETGPGISSAVTLAPRHQITSAPFALRAKRADTVANAQWTYPTLHAPSSWVNLDANTWGPLRTFRDPGSVVHLGGIIQAGNLGTAPWRFVPLFQLPVGQRPLYPLLLPVSGCCTTAGVDSHFEASLQINQDGWVYLRHINGTPASGSWLTLTGLSFRGEQ